MARPKITGPYQGNIWALHCSGGVKYYGEDIRKRSDQELSDMCSAPIVYRADDLPQPLENPPSNPELLDKTEER